MAVSASRMLIMDRHDLMSDPCDNQLIRCNNCIQLIACVCDTLALIDNSFDDLRRIIDLIAEITYHTISGCMTAQVAHEINYQEEQIKSGQVQGYSVGSDGNVVYAKAYRVEGDAAFHAAPVASPVPGQAYGSKPQSYDNTDKW
jgi:hypothetical protein